MEYNSVIPRLLERLPDFRVNYDDLVETFGDEAGVGAHVVIGSLFGSVLEGARRALNAPGSSSALFVHRALGFVEELASSENPLVQELVQSSFLEHMWQANEVEREYISGRLGAKTVRLWRETP